jgi:hypothetical protein
MPRERTNTDALTCAAISAATIAIAAFRHLGLERIVQEISLEHYKNELRAASP